MFLKAGAILAVAAAALAMPQQPQQPRYAAPPAQQQYRLVAQPQPQPQPQAQPLYQAQPQAQPQYVDPRQVARLRPAPAQQPGLQSQYQPDPEDFDPNPQYQFSFDVKDDEFTNYQNRKEQREGGKISGSYSVVDSDGFIRTVKYTADPLEGFKAEVTREPTNIVVKIPTPPPASPGGSLRHQQTQQYLQGTLQGVQPPQSQLFTTLGQLPKRLPHVAAPAAPAPAPAAPSGPRYSAAAAAAAQQAQQFASAQQAQQYAGAQHQQYSAGPAPAAAAPFSPAQFQQYLGAAAGAPAVAAAPRPKPLKAGAIGFATQPSGSVVYQAYQQ